MLLKAKIPQADYDDLAQHGILHQWNGCCRVTADILAAGNDKLTATWFGHLWWMLDLCEFYLDADSQEIRNKLQAVWNGMRHDLGDKADPFPRLTFVHTEMEDGEYRYDPMRIHHHILSEREYFLKLVYEVEE